ncbi:MAG: ParA family partition ATPase [Planctomycetota bacterium]|nr:ParA family partition ATPase [Planctomycetota bacterium]
MRVIGFLNQKGGVGKTTLAVHVADSLSRRGHRTMLIDADPQGSALDWASARDGEPRFPVAGLPRPSIHKELPALARGCEYVIIDGPPRVYDVARSAMGASDLIVIPVQPSPYDVWAAKEIVDMFAETAIYRPGLKAVFAINRRIVNTALGRDVVEALAAYPVPALKAAICQRVALAESAAQGRTVLETDPNGASAREIEAIVDELLGQFDSPQARGAVEAGRTAKVVA